MTVIAMHIREEIGGIREFSTANGLARYVRRRFPTKTIPEVMALWELTEGQAKGVVYAQASRTVVDKIKRHRRGGWRVMLEVDAAVIGSTVEDWLETEHQRIAHDRARLEADQRRLSATRHRLSASGYGQSARVGL
ncbi:MAG TPA: hypothetical protein VG248_03600 [Caulobacteraceae bacterium]|jgi:hypothetical protein|nr:hypothetical protein [Caulobacteraceae bacterium]